MKRKKRIEQWEAIIEDACVQSSRYKHIVVGGDFNTLFPKDAALTVQKFSNAGFQWATAAAGFTAHAFYRQIKPREDYIFSKGLQAVGGGKIDSSKASDHYPIYAIFRNRTAR